MSLFTLFLSKTKNAVREKGNGKMMKPLLGFFVLLLLNFTMSFGQTLLNDDLTALSVGNLGGQTGWTQAGSGPVAGVASASPITYGNGYPGGAGNYAVMPTASATTSRCYRTLSANPAGSSGTNSFYYSFILNIATASSTGDYFVSLGDPTTGTVYFGRVFAKSSGAGYVLGLSKSGNVAAANFGTTVFNFNTSYLVICRYSFVTGTTNDLNYLWVNPNTISEPTTGSAETSDNATTDASAATVGNFVWHNRTANNPSGKFDAIKVAAGTTSALAWSNLGANSVNGTIAAGEYGTHIDGQNQNTNSGAVTYMNWDANNLYVGVSGATLSEGFVMYLDKDPQTPVDGGTNANGTLIGQNYDGASFANLPWRADLVMYVKSGYREYRTATGSNTWSSATSGFGGYAENGTVREIAIPWSAVGGEPASFNFLSYNVSASGFVYNTQPTANAGGTIGTAARYERYYTVSSTSTPTPPFSRNSFVFNNTADENGFGAISVYDFTMNSAGRFISRTGATGSNWSIAGNLTVGNGTIYFGSGGTNGTYGSTTVSGNLDVRGGTLDMDQTTSPLTVNGNVSLSSGILKLSGNGFGGGDLNLKGNWSNIGGTFTPSLRAVLLTGTTAQLITKSASETFDYLIIDNTLNVIATNGVTVNQVLTLTNGYLSGGTTIVTNNATAAVTRTNGYINGNLRRAIATGTNTYTYALGTASGYTPASIVFTGTTGAGNVTVVSLNGASSNYPSSLSATKRVARYWTVTNTGVSGFTAAATFTYLAGDLVGGATQASVKPYKFDAPSTFTYPSSSTGTLSFTETGLTSFSEFGAGECGTVTVAAITGGGASICIGATQQLASTTPGGVWSSDASGTASVSSGGLVTGVAAGTTTIHYTVTDISGCTGEATQSVTVLPNYTITASAGSGGSVSPTGATTLCSGGSQSYTITPNACYSIADVVVDGVSQGAVGTYTFTNVTTNHSISASFVLNTYTITATAGSNGSITPATGSVNCGDNATYTITPNACYSIADVVVDGDSQGAVGTYTFTNVTTNHTISASFVLNTYSITVTAGSNGSITPATGTVNCGDNATYTITPNACYSIADVVVDGVSQSAVGTYTFTNVTTNHTISASFVLNTYTITVTAGSNGSITPVTGTVNCGDNATYTITPNACYSIADVVVDGVSQGAVGTYTFTNVTTNHTISASFTLNTYTITATAGANGSITPATGTVNCGDNASYTITPNACYSIADVVVDGDSQGAVGTYTFTNVTAAHTISASFVLNTYTITVTAGSNGSITPATGTVNCGDNATYTITPNACYSIADVVVDGVSQGAVGTYTFTNVTTNHTISASFTLNTYTITATAGANGSITPATGTVNCGDNATYTITPNACYSIADVVVDGVSQGTVGTYTFTNVTTNHTISASFVLNTYTITATAGSNGSITPATGTVNCGANATYTITPNACYSIADVVVDGVSQGAVGTYTFTNVTTNHTISASFVLNTYTITATAGSNGSITPATGTVNCGDNATYTITPNACYSIADVVVDGVSQGAVGTYTFTNVTTNHTISATFVLNTYTITATAGTGGSITPVTGTVNCGANATYTITADACYSIADVVVDGVSQGAVGTYTFTNVTAAHTISATFTLTTYTITATAAANGSITPATGSVNCGANATYTITPDACYHVADVLVDGLSVGAVTTYTFTNVTANHTIAATFAINATLTVSVSGIENVCPYVGTGTQITYTATSAGATGFTWVVPPTNVTIISGQGTANLTVTFQNGFTAQNNKQLRVTALSSCGNSPLFVYYLLAQAPGTPAPIVASNTNVCTIIGTPATFTYTIPSVLGATSYVWANPAGTTITHTNGLGINDTTVTLSFNNSFATANFTVASANGCGTSSARSISIVRASPSTPSLIAGPTNVCANIAPGGTAATYSIASVTGATSYTWTTPSGVIGFMGQGTTSISFTYPSTFTSGTVTVTATNGCGTSGSRTLAIGKLNPAAPGVIDVIQTGFCPNRVYSYTIGGGVPANATTVQWMIPAGGILVSGQGSSSITVSYPATSVTGTVTAQAFNNCGSSSIRKSEVRLPACPPDEPKLFSKGGNVVASETMTVNVYPNPGVTDFKLQVVTAGKEKITVRILDMQGRTFKNITVTANQTISIGSDLKSGSYLMEVSQGGLVKTTKLIKF